MQKIKTVYDTSTVARLLSEASGRNLTPADVRNLTRKGAILHRALIRGGTRGTYNVEKVKNGAKKMVRRRLAADLGRISPRFLSRSHSRECLKCHAVAVEWGGQVKCEEGHTYVEAVDPGSQEETAIVLVKDGEIVEEHHYPTGSKETTS